MPGPNTTGTPNTADYNLGRGIVYFSALTSGIPGAYRDLGNAPEFNVSVEVETTQHQSSRQGLKVVDKEVTISQTMTLTISLDELNHENLALFFAGVKATHTNAAVAGFAEWQMIVNVEKGRWYDIKNSSGARAYDVQAADLTVEKSGSPDTAMVLNTDYLLDSEMGRIFILSTGVVVADGDEIDVTLAANGAASGVDEVRTLNASATTGAVKFISVNPANNDARTEYQFHQVALKAEGDFSLIGDEFTVMQLTGVAERNETASPNSPTLTIRNVRP